MNNKGKRGQAALEFLTTYGWAFLVILVMIGALAYFGVLDPSRFVPQRCQFGAPLVCDQDNYIINTENVSVQLRNTLNSNYEIERVQIKNTTDGGWVDCAGDAVYTDGSTVATINTDAVGNFDCEYVAAGFPAATVGNKQRYQLQIFYEPDDADGTYIKTIPGEVYANVIG